MKQVQKLLEQIILLLGVSWILSGCSTGTPVATQFKLDQQAEAAGGGDAITEEDGPVDGGSEEDDVVDNEEGEAEEEPAEEEEAGPTPEELALMLRQQGKQVYDGMCMGCHMAPAASTLNSRDPALIAQQNTLAPHMGIAANFPNAEVAQAIVAYLNEPL